MSGHTTLTPPSDQPRVEYRDVPGFPGYRVGDDGSVWSCWRHHPVPGVRGGSVVRPDGDWRRMAPGRSHRGHLRVVLHRNGKSYNRSVHRLVLEAFVGPCPRGMQCRHFPDRNPENNALANLRWGTHMENTLDRSVHGTTPRGGAHWNAKLSDEQVAEILRLRRGGEARAVVARRFGVCTDTVGYIDRGLTWRHVPR